MGASGAVSALMCSAINMSGGKTMQSEIHYWTVRHPKYGCTSVTAVNRYFAVLSAAQEWGIKARLSLHAECDVERGDAVIPASPELEAEDYGEK